MHPIVSDGNRTIFYGSDLFPTAAHIPVQWVMSYDIQPMVSIKEKHKLLKNVSKRIGFFFLSMTLIFKHAPLIGMVINIK